MRYPRFDAKTALSATALAFVLVFAGFSTPASAQPPDKPPVAVKILPEAPQPPVPSPGGPPITYRVTPEGVLPYGPTADQDTAESERRVQREIQEQEVKKNAEALEQHLEAEFEELRKYLGDMVNRQDELADLVRRLVESGQAVAGDVAREAMEKARQELAEQQKNMAEMSRKLAEEAKARAEGMQQKAEEARQRELEQQQPVSRVITIEHADGDEILRVLQPLFDVQISPNQDGRVLGVRGTASAVAAFEEALKRLDVPPAPVRNIEIRVDLLAAGKPDTELPPLTPEMEEVVKALAPVFPYENYGLLESTFVRCRDGEGANVQGQFQGVQEDQVYKFTLASDRVVYDRVGDGVAFDKLIFAIDSVQYLGQMDQGQGGSPRLLTNATIEADIDLKNGQRAVVGKASLTGDYEAIFLVVTATVL